MARYFFNIDDGGDIIADNLGMELPSIAAAQCHAVQYAGRLICDHGDKFWNSGDWNMVVTSEAGLSLFSLQLVGTESPTVRAMHRPSEFV